MVVIMKFDFIVLILMSLQQGPLAEVSEVAACGEEPLPDSWCSKDTIIAVEQVFYGYQCVPKSTPSNNLTCGTSPQNLQKATTDYAATVKSLCNGKHHCSLVADTAGAIFNSNECHWRDSPVTSVIVSYRCEQSSNLHNHTLIIILSTLVGGFVVGFVILIVWWKCCKEKDCCNRCPALSIIGCSVHCEWPDDAPPPPCPKDLDTQESQKPSLESNTKSSEPSKHISEKLQNDIKKMDMDLDMMYESIDHPRIQNKYVITEVQSSDNHQPQSERRPDAFNNLSPVIHKKPEKDHTSDQMRRKVNKQVGMAVENVTHAESEMKAKSKMGKQVEDIQVSNRKKLDIQKKIVTHEKAVAPKEMEFPAEDYEDPEEDGNQQGGENPEELYEEYSDENEHMASYEKPSDRFKKQPSLKKYEALANQQHMSFQDKLRRALEERNQAGVPAGPAKGNKRQNSTPDIMGRGNRTGLLVPTNTPKKERLVSAPPENPKPSRAPKPEKKGFTPNPGSPSKRTGPRTKVQSQTTSPSMMKGGQKRIAPKAQSPVVRSDSKISPGGRNLHQLAAQPGISEAEQETYEDVDGYNPVMYDNLQYN